MITLNSCPVCGSLSITQFHQAGLAPHVAHEIMPGVFVDAAIISCYFVCQNCHVIFQNPRMSDQELNKFYKEGYLLELVKADFKVGVESDVNNVTAKGVKVYRQISEVPSKSFDLVSALHTLEHVPDPKSFLEDMIKLVHKNGSLVIEVPTWKSPGGPLRLPHLFHFEPDVLKLMCQEVGLKVLHVEFTPHLLLICARMANL